MVWAWLGLAVLAALTSAVTVVMTARRRWGPRAQVCRATLRDVGLDERAALVRGLARHVHPVRLVGIGGPAHRLDLSLIEEKPHLDVCGVPAAELAPLVGGRAYLVDHPVLAAIWLRTGMRSVRRVVALPRQELLRDFDLILHDPDGVGAEEERFRGSMGTVEISVTEQLHLYLELLVKPAVPLPGPSSSG
ncbi:hypothetical protein [Streptomyces sp. enrichment culture]|uniref:hypothetical protein n=1 Tax=Streptomyces sp. enrichment culture TaxID=1795815 RepID=UPI003F57F51E